MYFDTTHLISHQFFEQFSAINRENSRKWMVCWIDRKIDWPCRFVDLSLFLTLAVHPFPKSKINQCQKISNSYQKLNIETQQIHLWSIFSGWFFSNRKRSRLILTSKMIWFWSAVPKHFTRSSFFATTPFDTLMNTCGVCITSSRSVSLHFLSSNYLLSDDQSTIRSWSRPYGLTLCPSMSWLCLDSMQVRNVYLPSYTWQERRWWVWPGWRAWI